MPDSVSSNQYDSSDDSEEENEHSTTVRTSVTENMSMQERMQLLTNEKIQESFENLPRNRNKRLKRMTPNEDVEPRALGRQNKNAPAEMKSNKPVRRLRESVYNQQTKTRDPRFTEISGSLNHSKFLKDYQFLDSYQEDEVKKMDKVLKKSKSEDKRLHVKSELAKAKQQMAERRRFVKVQERIQETHAAEHDKVSNGKKPYFLKKSQVKNIAMEERYKELKQDGKLSKFLTKKRRRTANKDHRLMPAARHSDQNQDNY